jgi:hypothetical protein
VGEEDVRKTICAVASRVVALTRTDSQSLTLCKCDVIYYEFLLNNDLIR